MQHKYSSLEIARFKTKKIKANQQSLLTPSGDLLLSNKTKISSDCYESQHCYTWTFYVKYTMVTFHWLRFASVILCRQIHHIVKYKLQDRKKPMECHLQ